jgi:hypothetical protein
MFLGNEGVNPNIVDPFLTTFVCLPAVVAAIHHGAMGIDRFDSGTYDELRNE